MIFPEKLNLLRAAYKHFGEQRETVGDRRRRFHEHMNERKADRRGVTDPRLAARADDELAGMEAEAKVIEGEFKTAYDGFTVSKAFVEGCEKWLRRQGKVLPADGPTLSKPKLPVASRIVEQENVMLNGCRDEIEKLKAERFQIQDAPPPAESLVALKMAQIDACLELVCDPKKQLFHVEPSVLQIAANAEQLRKSLSGHISKTIGKNGVTPADKAARLSEIDAKIGELERQEEVICLRIEAAGSHVQRRADFPPSIFFETQLPIEQVVSTGTEG